MASLDLSATRLLLNQGGTFLHKWNRLFNATVLVHIWPGILFFTLIATAVSLLTTEHVADLGISNQMLSVLGTVLALVVSFRTSSAVERYTEGRKLWTVITVSSRNLANIIWIHVPTDREPKGKDLTPEELQEQRTLLRLKAVMEKKTMINLVQGFSVSVKHFLRGEGSIFYEDLYPLVSFLPRYHTAHPLELQGDSTAANSVDTLPLWDGDQLMLRKLSTDPMVPKRHKHKRQDQDPEKGIATPESEYVLRPARNPPIDSIYHTVPPLQVFRPLVWLIKRIFLGRRANDENKPTVEANVPLEITLFLSSYLAWLNKQALITVPISTAIFNNIASLNDALAQLERVNTTPLPFAYQAHLRMTMWLYLALLPFQIYTSYRILTIPATAFASFLLLGFLEIGQEIENPFQYDLNDLDLDTICESLKRELHEISAHPAPDPTTYIFSESNIPFAPGDVRSAMRVVGEREHAYHHHETGLESMRRTLLKSWREVSDPSRKTD